MEVIQLWREIKAKGYKGGRSAVYEYLKRHTQTRNKNTTLFVPHPSWVPAKVSLLLYREEASLSNQEKKLLKELRAISPDINTAYTLAQQFRNMIENKQGKLLTEWIRQTMVCSVHELKSFAKGLLSDFKAVKNAFDLP